MKKRIIMMSLMAIACLTMQAQTQKEVKVLAQCDAYFLDACPDATIDKKTKKKTIVWKDTENNSWHEDMGFVKDVPTINNLASIFPNFS